MNFLKIVNAILPPMLSQLIGGGFVGGGSTLVTFGLFKSNHTPVAGDTLSTYTAIESTFPGYSRLNVGNSSWSSPVVSANQAVSIAPTLLYTATSAPSPSETAYGYFVVNGAGTDLIWAQLFDTPVPVVNLGDVVIFTPQFTFSSQY